MIRPVVFTLLASACAPSRPIESPARPTSTPEPAQADRPDLWPSLFKGHLLVTATETAPIRDARAYIRVFDKRLVVGALPSGDDPGFAAELDKTTGTAAIAAALARLPSDTEPGWPATSPCGGGPPVENLPDYFDVHLAVRPGAPRPTDVLLIADSDRALHLILAVAYFSNRPIALAVRDQSGRPAALPLRLCADSAAPRRRAPGVVEVAVMSGSSFDYAVARSTGRVTGEQGLLPPGASAADLESMIRGLAFGAKAPAVRVRSRSAERLGRLVLALDQLVGKNLAPVVIAQPDSGIDLLRVTLDGLSARGKVRASEVRGAVSRGARRAAPCLARSAFEGHEPPSTVRVKLGFFNQHSPVVSNIEVQPGLSASAADCMRQAFANVQRREGHRRNGAVTAEISVRRVDPGAQPSRFESITGTADF